MELTKYLKKIVQKNNRRIKVKVLKEIIRGHINYRKQIFKLAKSDLAKTYRGSALRLVLGNY